ncbi:MAG: restriction endonuclease subunit S [Mucispirillum sp.]|nr:restriction endonuclease subunit S [Mucispirillum sp.]
MSHNAKKFYIEISTYLKFDVNIFDNFLIPISPLEVQAEIVKILNNFTELQARKNSMNIIEINFYHLIIF